jgi:hypothetical protein
MKMYIGFYSEKELSEVLQIDLRCTKLDVSADNAIAVNPDALERFLENHLAEILACTLSAPMSKFQ